MVKLVKLGDGVAVEIDIDDKKAREISSSDIVLTDTSLQQVESLLFKVISPFKSIFKEMKKELEIDTAKISVGISVGVEGGFFIAKSNVSANINVEITVRAQDD